MEPITIEEIAHITGGTLITGDPNLEIDSVSTDSRTAGKDSLFIPLKGENFDGHDFIGDAIWDRAVGAVLTERPLSDTDKSRVAVVVVDDTLKALQDMAAYNRRRYNIPIIAITGSSGKTTTKDMIYSVLSKKFNVLATEGNLNNEIGLPLTLLRLDGSHEVGVLELGMNHLGEIHKLANISLPDIGIITNIGLSHIGELGSRENIFKAKMELFDYRHSKTLAILNGDDPYLSQVDKHFLARPIKYIGTGDNSFRAYDIELKGDSGLSYNINIDGIEHTIELTIPGLHNIYNSLFAIAIGYEFDIPMEDIKEALYKFKPGNMRLNIFETHNGVKVIDDVYNANPNSMEAAVSILEDIESKRKIAVLGDMLELGSYSKEAHRDLGKLVAKAGIDMLITKGDDSRFIGAGAREEGMDIKHIYHFDCNKDVIDFLDTMIATGDTILVKGSRGMQMEEIISHLGERR